MSLPDRFDKESSTGAVDREEAVRASIDKATPVIGWVESDWFIKWLELARHPARC